MRNIPHSSMFHRSIHRSKTLNTNSPSHFSTANPAHMKHPLHSIHFLDGVYLFSRTPLVDLVECLGVGGTLDVAPVTVGWGASVEMIGLVVSPTLLPLSTVAGVVTLVISVTGNIECSFNWLKESKECKLVFPSKFHGCASACSSK